MLAYRKLLPLAVALCAACWAGCEKAEEGVIARVGGSAITETEFHRRLAEVAPAYQNYVMTPHGRKQFLDILVREKLILQASRRDGVDAMPEFKERMRQAREEAEERLAQARDYHLVRLWFERLRKSGVLKVLEAEIAEFHKKHPEEVVARHILLATPEEAETVLRQAREKGGFAALAKKHSLDADTASEGGKMNPTLRGEIIPELEVVFDMRVGEIGGPVRSKFGYHVLMKESERKVPLADVAERIRNVLEKQKLDKHLQARQASIPVEVIDAQFR
ncbi:MAG: peptidylprolyl isomerase [Elusimicrobiota bacterium]